MYIRAVFLKNEDPRITRRIEIVYKLVADAVLRSTEHSRLIPMNCLETSGALGLLELLIAIYKGAVYDIGISLESSSFKQFSHYPRHTLSSSNHRHGR